MSKKMVLHLYTGILGTGVSFFYELNKDYTAEELDEYAYERAVEHAQQYDIYPPEHLDEDQDIHEDKISNMICGWWEEYDQEQHTYYVDENVKFHKLDLQVWYTTKYVHVSQ